MPHPTDSKMATEQSAAILSGVCPSSVSSSGLFLGLVAASGVRRGCWGRLLKNLLHAFCECHVATDALGGQLRIVTIEADEGGVWELCGHLLEGEANDDRSVEAYAKLQEQEPLGGCCAYEVAVALGLPVPVVILHEGIVATEIHADGLSVRGMGNHFCGYAAVVDGWQSAFHPFPIVIQFLGRTRCWLKIAIVTLSGKDAIGVKSRHLELAVNIGGDDEVILAVNHLQQFLV